MEDIKLIEALERIDARDVEYAEWVKVGMALHEEGYPVEVWQEWSRSDPARFNDGECDKKWRTFGNYAGQRAKAGTIVDIAKHYGYDPRHGHDAQALGWDTLEAPDTAWVEPVETFEPEQWQGWRDVVNYLEAVFEPDDVVSYVMDSFKGDDGRIKPKGRGVYVRTASEICEKLNKHQAIDKALADYDTEGGAWIRFNPMDGKGVKNENVAEYRHALIECDELEIDVQRGLIEQLNLPVSALVHSGNKSLHAIVRIDAADYGQYRERVEFLYSKCLAAGLPVDTQNKNPSRLSRLPGVIRGNQKQWLVATKIGLSSWDEWHEWIEEQSDDLPEPETLASVWDNMPELAPPLIDGVLREGHKMLVSGPSKAGKSFALIELCVAIAEGVPWMGFNCKQGRVLYVNLELDRPSCLHRFKDVYKGMGIEPNNLASIEIWNLRGKSKPLDRLAHPLIRRAVKTRPIAVVIDPIYKVITGDENSADQMAAFCNHFDVIADQVGASVIYCHHHSKGSQGDKRAIDRSSGSGVFGRDPDAILDLIELERPEGTDRPETATPWRVEGTLREFEAFAPRDIWFQWPAHVLDDGSLESSKPESGQSRGGKTTGEKQTKDAEERALECERMAMELIHEANGAPVERAVIADCMGVDNRTIKKYINRSGVLESFQPVKGGVAFVRFKGDVVPQGWF